MAKKKVVKKVVKKSQIVDEPIIGLSSEEMLTHELKIKEVRLKELELLAIKQKKKILDLEFEKELTSKHNEYSKSKESESLFIKNIKSKYNILNDRFGYDHLTGEIRDE